MSFHERDSPLFALLPNQMTVNQISENQMTEYQKVILNRSPWA